MRVLVLVFWLLLPLPVIAYHLGPGQHKLAMEQVDSLMTQAEDAVATEDWGTAVACYDEALSLLPKHDIAANRRIRLERAKAQMFVSQLPVAHSELNTLVEELRDDPGRDQATYRDARATLANAQYYMTWLMRLEGQSRERWEPEIEAARQSLVLLAEEAKADGLEEIALKHQEDLESAIRLARMSLSDLQGLPLPSQ